MRHIITIKLLMETRVFNQLTEVIEYTDSISAEKLDPLPTTSVLYKTRNNLMMKLQ